MRARTTSGPGTSLVGTINQSKALAVSTRLPLPDALRGFLLLVMIVDHLGGLVARHLYQAAGFFTAAEGFFFLSGTMAVHARAHSLRKRALQVWGVHLVLLVALVAWAGFMGWNQGGLHALLWSNGHLDVMHWLAAVFLLYRPDYLDVLPLYVMFLPVASFLVGKQWTARGLVWLWLASTVLWVVNLAYSGLASQAFFGGDNLRIYGGSFAPLAWQWIYFTGFVTASLVKKPAPWLTGLAAIVFVSLLILSRQEWFMQLDWVLAGANRENLGWLRMVQFLAAAWLVYIVFRDPSKSNLAMQNPWPHWALRGTAPLRWLGRNSLWVFAAHIPLVFWMRY